jgi:hypothetical protein
MDDQVLLSTKSPTKLLGVDNVGLPDLKDFADNHFSSNSFMLT